MEHYDLEVCGLKRELPFVKLSDGTAYASFVVISDTELIEKAGKELAAFANGAEIILTIEAKGIALAYEISKQLHMKEFVVVRKSVKSYVKSFIQDAVHSITTEGNQDIFLDETDAEKLKGKKVAIVDDVISRIPGCGRASGAESRRRGLQQACNSGRGKSGRADRYHIFTETTIVSERKRIL